LSILKERWTPTAITVEVLRDRRASSAEILNLKTTSIKKMGGLILLILANKTQELLDLAVSEIVKRGRLYSCQFINGVILP